MKTLALKTFKLVGSSLFLIASLLISLSTFAGQPEGKSALKLVELTLTLERVTQDLQSQSGQLPGFRDPSLYFLTVKAQSSVNRYVSESDLDQKLLQLKKISHLIDYSEKKAALAQWTESLIDDAKKKIPSQKEKLDSIKQILDAILINLRESIEDPDQNLTDPVYRLIIQSQAWFGRLTLKSDLDSPLETLRDIYKIEESQLRYQKLKALINPRPELSVSQNIDGIVDHLTLLEIRNACNFSRSSSDIKDEELATLTRNCNDFFMHLLQIRSKVGKMGWKRSLQIFDRFQILNSKFFKLRNETLYQMVTLNPQQLLTFTNELENYFRHNSLLNRNKVSSIEVFQQLEEIMRYSQRNLSLLNQSIQPALPIQRPSVRQSSHHLELAELENFLLDTSNPPQLDQAPSSFQEYFRTGKRAPIATDKEEASCPPLKKRRRHNPVDRLGEMLEAEISAACTSKSVRGFDVTLSLKDKKFLKKVCKDTLRKFQLSTFQTNKREWLLLKTLFINFYYFKQEDLNEIRPALNELRKFSSTRLIDFVKLLNHEFEFPSDLAIHEPDSTAIRYFIRKFTTIFGYLTQ